MTGLLGTCPSGVSYGRPIFHALVSPWIRPSGVPLLDRYQTGVDPSDAQALSTRAASSRAPPHSSPSSRRPQARGPSNKTLTAAPLDLHTLPFGPLLRGPLCQPLERRASKSPQRLAERACGLQRGARGNERQQEATRGNERQREATRGNERQREATRGNERPIIRQTPPRHISASDMAIES
jgi:hypothetical protein